MLVAAVALEARADVLDPADGAFPRPFGRCDGCDPLDDLHLRGDAEAELGVPDRAEQVDQAVSTISASSPEKRVRTHPPFSVGLRMLVAASASSGSTAGGGGHRTQAWTYSPFTPEMPSRERSDVPAKPRRSPRADTRSISSRPTPYRPERRSTLHLDSRSVSGRAGHVRTDVGGERAVATLSELGLGFEAFAQQTPGRVIRPGSTQSWKRARLG